MNLALLNMYKKRIRLLKTERDDLFSILDEVNHLEQVILIQSIKELTDEININKSNIRRLLKWRFLNQSYYLLFYYY